MEKDRSAQYTFGANEKEILEILESFQNEFAELSKDHKRDIVRVEYYEIFKMKKGDIPGLFVTIEQSAEGISYHLYFQSPQNEIGSMDENGNINIKEEWKDTLWAEDIKKCIENEKQEGLKGISEKTEPHEMSERLDKSKKEETNKEQEEDKSEEQIQRDIGGQEDLGISYYRQINDINFGKQIGMNLNGYQEIGLAFSQTKNAFILVGKKDGIFEQVEGFKLAQPTLKKVISIDEQGENVETEVPHALMKTNNPDKELSITIGQYGYIEVGTIDRLPCDKRVKRQVREKGETDRGRTVTSVNNAIEYSGKNGLDNWVHNKNHMRGDTSQTADVAEEISQNSDEYIPETDITWIEFANKCGYRGDGAIEHAKEIFSQEKEAHPNIKNKELVEKIINQKESEARGIGKK